jgi:hypothetical protein
MAAVINELVSQRREMRANFGPMHQGMRGPMMGRERAMDCPMMNRHDGMQADAPKKESTQ